MQIKKHVSKKVFALLLAMALLCLTIQLPVVYMDEGEGGEFTAYEAEAEGNVRVGNASVNECEACSGGFKVGNLYQGSSLQISGVTAAEDGVYKMRIHYTSGDPRTVYIAANGGSACERPIHRSTQFVNSGAG